MGGSTRSISRESRDAVQTPIQTRAPHQAPSTEHKARISYHFSRCSPRRSTSTATSSIRGTLSKVLDLILLHGGDYEITTFTDRHHARGASHAEIVVRAGACRRPASHPAGDRPARRRGRRARRRVGAGAGRRRLPRRISTRRRTSRARPHTRAAGCPSNRSRWTAASSCDDAADGPHAVTVPVHRVRKGDRVLVARGRREGRPGAAQGSGVGVRLHVERRLGGAAEGADALPRWPRGMVDTRREGRKILFVGGPAIIHTGAGGYLEQLIARRLDRRAVRGQRARDARHRIRAARDVARHSAARRARRWRPGTTITCARSTPIRARRRHPPAVEKGVLTRGVMHACVTHGVDYVLAGSIRDDGPLPDVITDSRPCAGRDARACPGRRPRDHGGDDAALRGDGEPAAGVGADHLRGQQHGHDHQAHGPRHTARRSAW